MADALDFLDRATILVVDDTPENLSLMSGLLKDQYKVKVANNGEKALKIARTLPRPDLILLDIMMPGISGYDVCRELKADRDTAAETRDSDTGNQIRRTQYYVKALAEKLRDHPRFRSVLDERMINMLFKSAPLHDIGKVGIPDRILLKPGRFTPDEFDIMKTHTTLGRDAIVAAEKQLGMEVEFLNYAKEIAYGHQEKWDGSGYPESLAGETIPVSARLMAIADVYDALISRRVYKDGMPHEKAVQIIVEGKGKHFDPDMVDAFVAIAEDFRDIATRFADSDEDMSQKAEMLERFGANSPA